MELTRRNILDLKSLDATFNDSLLDIKQDRVFYEQGIDLNYIHGLSGAVDSSIKNFSSLYLTKQLLDTTVFELNDVRLNPPVIFTRIGAKPIYVDTVQLDLYLRFDKVSLITPSISGLNSCTFSREVDIVDFEDSVFEIELLPENLCRIKHVYNGDPYYLSYDTTQDPPLTGCGNITPINLVFKKITGSTSQEYYDAAVSDINSFGGLIIARDSEDIFEYNLSNNELVLFKTTENCTTLNPYGLSGGVLTVTGPTVGDITLTPVLSTSPVSYDDTKILYIVDTRIEPKLKLNTSWVTYEKDTLTTGKIDENISRFDLPSNNIMQFEYNESTDKHNFSILKLKNILSDKHFTKRQSYIYGIQRPVDAAGTITPVITSVVDTTDYLDSEDLTLTDLACPFDVDSISLLTEDLSGMIL